MNLNKFINSSINPSINYLPLIWVQVALIWFTISLGIIVINCCTEVLKKCDIIINNSLSYHLIFHPILTNVTMKQVLNCILCILKLTW